MLTRSVPVIEDEAVVALFLSDILRDLKHEICAVAASGREGLALAARHRPAPVARRLLTPGHPKAALADAVAPG